MTQALQKMEFMVFNVDNRNVFLDKELVEKYSDIVCPVNETFLSSMVHFFGKDCQDDVLSYAIASDMAKELHEYGA